MRTLVFAKRNVKEMIYNPTSYIFALGFPVLMIVLFAVINSFVQGGIADAVSSSGAPAEVVIAQATKTFQMKNNAPAMAFFGMTFIMLALTLLVSNDKNTDFLSRLFSSPMTAVDFTVGYILPALALCFAQQIICYCTADVVGLIEGSNFDGSSNTFGFVETLLCILTQIPSMLLFTSLGVLVGTVFGAKSSPAFVSVFINVAGIFGGCYMPLENMSGLATVCKFLPFYPQVLASQAVMNGAVTGFSDFWLYEIIVSVYAVAVCATSAFAFARYMKGK